MLKEGIYFPSFHFLFEGEPQEIVHDHPLILTMDKDDDEPRDDNVYLSVVFMKLESQGDAQEIRKLFKTLVDKYNPSAACVIIPGQYKEMNRSEFDKCYSLILDPESVQVLSITYFLPEDPEGKMKLITIYNRGEIKDTSSEIFEKEKAYDLTFFDTNWTNISRKLDNPYPNPYRN